MLNVVRVEYTLCSKKTSTFLFFNNSCQELTEFNNFWCVESWENLTWTTYLSDVAIVPWQIQKKIIFNRIIYTYFRLFMLSQKKTNCNCCTAASLLTYCCLVLLCSHSTASGACYRTSACIEYLSVIWTSCGSGLLRHGLNISTAWCTMRLISVEKDWKHVSMQKVVTLNTCCDFTCLAFQFPHITTNSFQSHQCQPTTGSFQGHQHLKECINPSVRLKSFALHKFVWWHFRMWWLSGFLFVSFCDNK